MSDLGDKAAAWGVAITICSAWLYLIGWSYSFYFFQNFGVGLLELNIPRDFFFVYAFDAITSPTLKAFYVHALFLLMALAVFLIKDLVGFSAFKNHYLGQGSIIAVTALFIGLWGFLLGFAVATDTFVRLEKTNYIDMPTITVQIKPYSGYPVPTDKEKLKNWRQKWKFKTNKRKCYKYLIKNNDVLYILNSKSDGPFVVALPMAQVEQFNINNTRGYCSP